uniref:Uncharacterized protein n=1 Tax=Glossina morsitans morsitans TaxID=37546 RepID=A0A1B0GCI3_GLOMM
MSMDLMFHCVLLLLLTIFLMHTTAYITGSSNVATKLTDPEDGLTIGKMSFLEPARRGKFAFKPQDLKEYDERTVYDPGDELKSCPFFTPLHQGELNPTEEVREINDYEETISNDVDIADKDDILQRLHQDLRDEQDMVTKSNILIKMLEDPHMDTLPLVYIEEEAEDIEADTPNNNINSNNLTKRSRYYRRYPWKRHHKNRNTYEPELRYACTPTKDDVFRLLVNLHENRNGRSARKTRNSNTINFCNRKRPAKAIFTNIRFLG